MSGGENGPAFPVPGCQDDSDFNGLSRREYFAAHAPDIPNWFSPGYSPESMMQRLINWRWHYADAMIEAGAK